MAPLKIEMGKRSACSTTPTTKLKTTVLPKWDGDLNEWPRKKNFFCNCGGRKSKLIARKKTKEKEKRISPSISLHTMKKWRGIRVPRLHWISFFYFHASGFRKLVEALFLSCVVRYLHVARRSVSIITMIMLFLFPAQYPTF